MIRRVVNIIICIALVFVLFAGITTATAGAQSSDLKIGVFFPDPDSPDEEIPNAGDVHGFESTVDRQIDIFLWYESISETFYSDYFRPMAQEGRIIQLSWEPHQFGRDPLNQPEYRLERITAGDWDNEIRRWARELRDFGYQVYFRPMSEMNGDWVTWGGTVNGNTPDDYVPAWRHIHGIFVDEGATNVKFVWSPNRDGSTADAQNTFNTYYPGDAYVDYVGINGYNWGTLFNTPEWTSSWQLIDEVFGYSYDVFASRTSKPLMISETASTEVGGNKAQWINDAFAQLPVRFPRVESITWFNINKETDWRVESSAASLEAFRDAVGQGTDYSVTEPIRSKWDALGRAPGEALSAEYEVPGGRAQDFQNGRLIYNEGDGKVFWVHGAILARYAALGGPSGVLGLPASDEQNVTGRPGARKSEFEGGHIYWAHYTGARALYGVILDKYLALGGPGGFAGLPVTDVADVNGVAGAKWARLQGANIYTSTAGTFEVHGAILARYAALGGPSGVLGLPASDEQNVTGRPGARKSEFEGGHIYWAHYTGARALYGVILDKYLALGGPGGFAGLPVTDVADVNGVAGAKWARLQGANIYTSTAGTFEVHGAILARYAALGGPAAFGLPISDESDVSGVAGARMNGFERLHIYWSRTTGAREVHGAILSKFVSLGGASFFGLPLSDEYGVPGGRAGNFQKARIYWSAATGAHEVHGAVLAKYLALGGPGGFAGFPQSDEEDAGVTGGRESHFQGASIYWSRAVGAREVHGAIRARYLESGGSSGDLGLPKSDEYGVPGGRANNFQSGNIRWTPSGGARLVN